MPKRYRNRIEDVAEAITCLRYSEMTRVAECLSGMTQKGIANIPFDSSNAQHWSELLIAWAEVTMDLYKKEAGEE